MINNAAVMDTTIRYICWISVAFSGTNALVITPVKSIGNTMTTINTITSFVLSFICSSFPKIEYD